MRLRFSCEIFLIMLSGESGRLSTSNSRVRLYPAWGSADTMPAYSSSSNVWTPLLKAGNGKRLGEGEGQVKGR